MRKPTRKLYRLTPLNMEIKRVEYIIYKNEDLKNENGEHLDAESYLLGLKTAHRLVKARFVEEHSAKNIIQ